MCPTGGKTCGCFLSIQKGKIGGPYKTRETELGWKGGTDKVTGETRRRYCRSGSVVLHLLGDGAKTSMHGIKDGGKKKNFINRKWHGNWAILNQSPDSNKEDSKGLLPLIWGNGGKRLDRPLAFGVDGRNSSLSQISEREILEQKGRLSSRRYPGPNGAGRARY